MSFITVNKPSGQRELRDMAAIFDTAFNPPAPVSTWRIGLLDELIYGDQLVLLAKVDDQPAGAVVALRGKTHVSLTHIAVSDSSRVKGVGRSMFESVVAWANENDRDEVRWFVSPTNQNAIAAYLSWGARITTWFEDGYNIDADPDDEDQAPKVIGRYRSDWSSVNDGEMQLQIGDFEGLRNHLDNGYHVVGRDGDRYVLRSSAQGT